MIVILDYDMGNIGSIRNMLRRIGAESCIGSTPESVRGAGKLILPGVGAFDEGMRNLEEKGLKAPLQEAVVERKIPVLGICLGMQLLTRVSEEGALPGLGWIDAETIRFRIDHTATGLKIPHMGWNVARPRKLDSLFRDMDAEARFYFVHSYHVVCRDQGDVLAECHHGYDFACAVQRGNVYGTQFHPEKSHRFGMQVLKNYVEL